MNEEREVVRNRKKSIMEEKIDRLENHFKVYKSDMVDVKDSVRNIESALIGSSLNGHKGMVSLLDSLDKRVQALEDKQILDADKLDTLKWFQRGLIGIVFSYLLWLMTK
jgi:chaperonin cofactor prefoldin